MCSNRPVMHISTLAVAFLRPIWSMGPSDLPGGPNTNVSSPLASQVHSMTLCAMHASRSRPPREWLRSRRGPWRGAVLAGILERGTCRSAARGHPGAATEALEAVQPLGIAAPTPKPVVAGPWPNPRYWGIAEGDPRTRVAALSVCRHIWSSPASTGPEPGRVAAQPEAPAQCSVV